jgi:vancomycin resistance protein VanJ
MEAPPVKPRGIGCAWASLALFFLAAAFYTFRWDIVYAATVYPAWVFAVLGLVIVLAARPRPFWRVMRWPMLAWLVFVCFFAEEMTSTFRLGSWPSAAWNANRPLGRALRVVSLNCAGGTVAAAEEVRRFSPDIVLLQESPSRPEVEKLANELFGADGVALVGQDASIVSRKPLTPLAIPRREANFVAAEVRLPSGEPALVVSLRLAPPALRFDYWNPECWTDFAQNLSNKREELGAIAAFVKTNRKGLPLLLGGDFNSGPNRTMSNRLPADLSDSFREAGHGWGHTAVNDGPLVRIDQIWLSSPLNACFAQRTENSDHRMVVCDVIVK